jgi:hypothetical protein
MNIKTSKQIQNYNTAMTECGCCMGGVSEINKGVYGRARLNRNTPTRWPELTKPITASNVHSPHIREEGTTTTHITERQSLHVQFSYLLLKTIPAGC